MNLKQIKEKIKPGEIARLKCSVGYIEYSFNNFEKPKYTSGLMFDCALSEDWEIITIEPKVLTVDEWMNEFKLALGHAAGALGTNEIVCIKQFFEFVHKNGRIERDLELRSAIDAANNVIYYDYISEEHNKCLSDTIKNIPPL